MSNLKGYKQSALRRGSTLAMIVAVIIASASAQTMKVEIEKPHTLKTMFQNGLDARILMWGRQNTFQNLNMKIKAAGTGCSAYTQPVVPTVPTVFLVSGLKECPLSNLIHNAQAAGASALFVWNQDDVDINKVSVPDHMNGVHIHVFLVSKRDGEKLESAVKAEGVEDPMLKIDFIVSEP